ncbi:MAG: T9SS type A sorting domain-containing protein, partial [bacterium]
SFILKTTDGGGNWAKYTINENALLVSMHFINEQIGWVVGNYNGGNNLFKTVDGGETWNSQDVGEICNLYSVYFINDQNGWVAGYDYLNRKSCIFYTKDSGEHWYNQQSPLTGYLSSLYFSEDSTGWAVGSNGTILKTTNGVGTNIGEIFEYQNYPENFKLFQNYPNPFNPTTTIRYVISKPGFVSLKVYDLLGREVETLIKEYQLVGRYEIRWTGENHPSGLYLYKLQAGDFCETRKFILTK